MRYRVRRGTALLLGLVLLLTLLAGCGRQSADPQPPSPPDEAGTQTGGDPVPPENNPVTPAPENNPATPTPENNPPAPPEGGQAPEGGDTQSPAGQQPPSDPVPPPADQSPEGGQAPEENQPSGTDPVEPPPEEPETPSVPEDGQYTAAVTLAGGSGRATVSSPAQLRCENGQFWATIVWSSPNFDYMKVDGVKYELVSTEGNSTFEIPVAAFDQALPVIADTIAMSEPHEVEYTLTFDSATLEKQ